MQMNMRDHYNITHIYSAGIFSNLISFGNNEYNTWCDWVLGFKTSVSRRLILFCITIKIRTFFIIICSEHTQLYVRIDILFTHGRHLHGHIISLRNESWTHKIILNQHQRNSKGQSRMDNPETVATLGTQDENKQPQKHNTTQKTATLI